LSTDWFPRLIAIDLDGTLLSGSGDGYVVVDALATVAPTRDSCAAGALPERQEHA